LTDIERTLATSAAPIYTHREFTSGTVVKLANGLRGDRAIDMDLTNHNSVILDLLHDYVAK
jgi:hypothetical protein